MWNDLLSALIVIPDRAMRPLTAFLANSAGGYGQYITVQAAGASLFTIPPMTVFLLAPAMDRELNRKADRASIYWSSAGYSLFTMMPELRVLKVVSPVVWVFRALRYASAIDWRLAVPFGSVLRQPC